MVLPPGLDFGYGILNGQEPVGVIYTSKTSPL